VVVLSFEVTGKTPATDLVNFIESGYDFVLDADLSNGEDEKGNYRVFIEIERGRKIDSQVNELIYGLSELSGNSDWKFRYYKDFESKPLVELSNVIPNTAEEYSKKMGTIFESEMRFFFRKSPLDYFFIEGKTLVFKRPFNNPVRLEIVEHGTRTTVLNKLAGNIRVDESSMSEVFWLTKYFGDYNITKYSDHFVFENDNSVLVLNLIR
jgi:hypothetical protein